MTGLLRYRQRPGQTWRPIPVPGPDGPQGLVGPTGPTGPADVASAPRLAYSFEQANPDSVMSSATINTFVQCCQGQVTIDPTKTYMIFAGLRAVDDPGVGAMCQAQVALGTVNLPGYDVWVCQDPNRYWGAWNQFWCRTGDTFTAVTADLDIRLNLMINVASKNFFSPRLTVMEYV